MKLKHWILRAAMVVGRLQYIPYRALGGARVWLRRYRPPKRG
jgi:hypothetical protein